MRVIVSARCVSSKNVCCLYRYIYEGHLAGQCKQAGGAFPEATSQAYGLLVEGHGGPAGGGQTASHREVAPSSSGERTMVLMPGAVAELSGMLQLYCFS